MCHAKSMIGNETRELGLSALNSFCSKDHLNKIANSKQSKTFFNDTKYIVTFREHNVNTIKK